MSSVLKNRQFILGQRFLTFDFFQHLYKSQQGGISMADTYRLYVSTSCRAFLSKENEDPNALEAYLTDTQNRVLPNLDNALFENKPKPKPLRHLLRTGKEVQVCSVSKNSPPLPQCSFMVGKAYRIQELACTAILKAAEISNAAYASAKSKAVEEYGKKIVDAQQKSDLDAEYKARAEMEHAISLFPKPVTFEQLVKQLAARLLIKRA
jgi:hypothetical protein